jgi:hypothetical protein
MMIVWAVWEAADCGADLRALMRAVVAGCWVLAMLTVLDFVLTSTTQISTTQVRFAAQGQDPNDVARFLDLGLPLATLLFASESRWPMCRWGCWRCF